MKLSDLAQILLAAVAIATAITVGRSNLKKQTIIDQQNLIIALMNEISVLRTRIDTMAAEHAKQSAEKDAKIEHLEEVIDGYSELVREGYLAGSDGQGGGNRPVNPKATKNRSP